MKISIIIPVYNSEKYLKKCINSVLRQSYKNIELILIDDESRDSSPQICDLYQEKDCRVKVIHKANGGTADARNMGLSVATGEYITFIDNDDYWKDKDALREIVKQLEKSKADVLMFNTMEYWENKHKYTCSKRSCDRKKIVFQNRTEAVKEMLKNGLLYRAVWAKVIKKELILQNDLYFEKGIRNEDTDWTAKMLLCAQSYDWYEKVFYVYRKGTGSAQTDMKVSHKEIQDLMNILLKYIDIGEKKLKDDKDFLELFYSYLAYPYAVLMGQVCLKKEKELEKQVRNKSYILNYDLDPSVKKVRCIYSILGYKLTSMLLKIYLLR